MQCYSIAPQPPPPPLAFQLQDSLVRKILFDAVYKVRCSICNQVSITTSFQRRSSLRLDRMICSKCQTAFSDQRISSPNGPDEFHQRFYHCSLDWLYPDLKASECLLCSLLQFAFRDDRELSRGLDLGYWLEYVVEANGTYDDATGTTSTRAWSLYYNISGIASSGDDRVSGGVLYRLEIESASSDSMRTSLRPPLNQHGDFVGPPNASGLSYGLAQSWMIECQSFHELCQNRNSVRWRPTRLLHINETSISDAYDASIRLQITANEPVDSPYMTLSHCWGGNVSLVLTAETYAKLKSGVSIKDIPSTFSDAVCATLMYGVRYLWIDSLCIFQDSPEDWREESSMMGQVYSNSYCNIAATCSRNATGGLFGERHAANIAPVRINATWQHDEADYDSPPPGEYICYSFSMWSTSIETAPLGSRAWVVQEQCLAPRQLHFAYDQVFWECRELSACETFPSGARFGRRDDGLKSFIADIERYIESREGTINLGASKNYPIPTLDAIYDGWRLVVGYYSACALTFSRDKLVALSGIAEKMYRTVGDDYLAGLWKSRLSTQLLWRTEGLDCKESEGFWAIRAQPYRAPTWSWASTEARVYCQASPLQSLSHEISVEILDAAVTTIPGFAFGQVTDGFIKLKGTLHRVEVLERYNSQRIRTALHIDDLRIEGNVHPDEFPRKDASTDQTVEKSRILSLYYLPIFCYRSVDGDVFFQSGLLLSLVELAKMEFERYGYFDTHSRQSLKALAKHDSRVFGRESSLPCDQKATVTIK